MPASIGHNNPPFDFLELFDTIVSSSATTAEKLISLIHARHIGKKGEPAYPSRSRVIEQSSTSANTYQRSLPVVRLFFDVETRRGRATKYAPKQDISVDEIERAIAGLRTKMIPHKSIPQNGVYPKSVPQHGVKPCPKMGQHKDSKILINADDNARAISDLNFYQEQILNAANGAVVNFASSPGLLLMSEPIAWIEQGCDLHKDILPAIKAVANRSKPNSINSWRYFNQAVADAKRRRTAPMPEGRAAPEEHWAEGEQRRARRGREALEKLKQEFANG